jgi:signal transduction histidine kinase
VIGQEPALCPDLAAIKSEGTSIETPAKNDSPGTRSLPEALARSLRHEVGDLLQTVYATVAILQKRLPENYSMERRLLGDMRARAETCKNRLDTVHDLVCPLGYSCQPVDLAELAAGLVANAKGRHPHLQIEAEAIFKPTIIADASRIAQIGEILLTNACEAARSRVILRTRQGSADGEAEWEMVDDGPGMPTELLSNLFKPFFTTRHGHAGVGLALAQKLTAGHGGRIAAENLPEGGFRARVNLPRQHPKEATAIKDSQLPNKGHTNRLV